MTRNLRHVVRAHAGGQQRLVRIAHRRVRDEHSTLGEHPVGECPRTLLVQNLLRSGRGWHVFQWRYLRVRMVTGKRTTLDLRVAVDDHLAKERQQSRGTVAPLREIEQLRCRVDELRRVVAGREMTMQNDLLQEPQVGRHAANSEFKQGPVHAPHGLLGGGRPGGDFDEQRVVGPADERAGIGGPRIETDAESRRAAVGRQLPVVGHEVVRGILGRDPALHGVAVRADLRLYGHAAGGTADLVARGNADLSLDDVDAGDDLGHGVLYLDARVDLDEIDRARVRVLQELHGAGTLVVRGPTNLQPHLAQRLALGLREEHRGCAFDHLLVAALDRAVPLPEVDQIAVGIAEQLDFDMTRPAHELLEVDLVVAEGGLRLAAGLDDALVQMLCRIDDPHAASAAAPAGLEHHWIADLGRKALHLGRIRG